jgi:DNA-binding FadR family transcriptional regulator
MPRARTKRTQTDPEGVVAEPDGRAGKASVPRHGRERVSRRRAKISQLIAIEIVRDIVQLGLEEGDQLPNESEMLEEFDVGRASLREALRLLEVYGLIELRQGQNGGPVVAALRPEDLGRTLSFYFHMTGATYGELVEARLVIEPVMARLAAERQDPEQIKALVDVIEREAAASFEEREYVRHTDEFHYMVSGMSGNGVLDLIGRGLRTLYQDRTDSGAFVPREDRPHKRSEHQAIGDAIRRADGDEAARLMAEHLDGVAQVQFEGLPALREDRIRWNS